MTDTFTDHSGARANWAAETRLSVNPPGDLIVRIFTSLAILSATVLTAASALADPPERVGLVAYVEGGVALRPPESEDWTQAFVNFPAAEGEGFWTGDDGRVELRIGGVAARLDSETELDIDALRWDDMRLALAQGSVNIQVRGFPEGGVLVATPAGDVHLEGRGFYRIDVAAPDESGDVPAAEVTVFQGQAEAPSPEGYAPIYPGQAASLYAGYDPQVQEAEDSAIDDWSRERIRAEYVPGGYALPEAMSGAADLARWGEFVQTPEFGLAWFPRDVPPDWAPYRFGRWVDVAPWGYTWVDDSPWGFAPFHYGRWASIDGRWAWIPGQSEPRPVYAPALVAFVGGGGWGAAVWRRRRDRLGAARPRRGLSAHLHRQRRVPAPAERRQRVRRSNGRSAPRRGGVAGAPGVAQRRRGDRRARRRLGQRRADPRRRGARAGRSGARRPAGQRRPAAAATRGRDRAGAELPTVPIARAAPSDRRATPSARRPAARAGRPPSATAAQAGRGRRTAASYRASPAA